MLVTHLVRTAGPQTGPAAGADGDVSCDTGPIDAATKTAAAEEDHPCRPRPGSPASRYFQTLYCRAFERDDFYFEHSFPSGARRARVISAARGWSRAGSRLQLIARTDRRLASIAVRRTRTGIAFTAADCRRSVDGRPASVVKWVHIDGPGKIAGVGGACLVVGANGTPTSLRNFTLALDRDEHWFTRRSGRPGPDQIDLQGVALHEIGHGTGWNTHLDDRSRSPDCPRVTAAGRLVASSVKPTIGTMCSLNARGTTYQRTPSARDLEIFRSAYG